MAALAFKIWKSEIADSGRRGKGGIPIPDERSNAGWSRFLECPQGQLVSPEFDRQSGGERISQLKSC